MAPRLSIHRPERLTEVFRPSLSYGHEIHAPFAEEDVCELWHEFPEPRIGFAVEKQHMARWRELFASEEMQLFFNPEMLFTMQSRPRHPLEVAEKYRSSAISFAEVEAVAYDPDAPRDSVEIWAFISDWHDGTCRGLYALKDDLDETLGIYIDLRIAPLRGRAPSDVCPSYLRLLPQLGGPEPNAQD